MRAIDSTVKGRSTFLAGCDVVLFLQIGLEDDGQPLMIPKDVLASGISLVTCSEAVRRMQVATGLDLRSEVGVLSLTTPTTRWLLRVSRTRRSGEGDVLIARSEEALRRWRDPRWTWAVLMKIHGIEFDEQRGDLETVGISAKVYHDGRLS